jgi:molecular chaperone GrpE (heat shock protein)
MSNSILLNPKHWRDRAEKTRAKADVSLRDDLKKRLLRVAEEYERLAQRAEHRSQETVGLELGTHHPVIEPVSA